LTALNVHALLLAAGASSRLGRPKQLERLHGVAFVRHAAEACLASRVRYTHVVLGGHAPAVRQELAGLDLDFVTNDRFLEGVSSSIQAGLSALGDADGVLIVLADQPLLRPEILDALVLALPTPSSVAACSYAGGLGAPAAFGRAHFGALAALEGDRGAKTLFSRAHVTPVAFPEGVVDIDTEEDLRRAADRRGDPQWMARSEGDGVW
jgi:CTP:molybdopterin cytidylyltransferase MocA